jgi:hypothetical protein
MYNTFKSMTNTYVQKIKNKKISLIQVFAYRGRDLEDVVGEKGDIEDKSFR